MIPSLEEIRNIAKTGQYRRIPVRKEILADHLTTMEAVRCLEDADGHVFILESAENGKPWGRYSFLGYDPAMEITCRNGHLRVTDKNGEVREENTEHPAQFLRELLRKYKSPVMEDFPSFTGGLVGYFSYDYIEYAEPRLRGLSKSNKDFEDVDLMLFDKVICFDHCRQKILLITLVDTDNLEESYKKAERTVHSMKNLLLYGKEAEKQPLQLLSHIKPERDKEAYSAMVRKAKHYIVEGDIFQVVLSNPLTARAKGSLLDVYRILRVENPSPYMFYFSGSSCEIAGASPETLAKLHNGTLYTFPLAGTRRRGKTEEEDKALEQELIHDEKELAEHNMLVDLGRNDLGKVSAFGTVEVEKYREVLRYSHVMHIGSTVRGKLADGKDALDVIDAVLPAGTLSGAPKIRACEIIGELETRKRGIYGGAMGYIDFSGNMDVAIGIRLAYKKDGVLCIQSGAGIVADSVPEKEYQECINKAKAVVEAVNMAAEKGDLL